MSERSWSLTNMFRGVFGISDTISSSTWQELEDAMISGDFGPDLTEAFLENLQSEVERLHISEVNDLHRMFREQLEERLEAYDSTLRLTERPSVVLVVGVNGVGKTTTIGKLAHYLQSFNKKVLVAAADTFRAAAVEQLGTWAERAKADIVTPAAPGQDPASVAFQAVQRAINEHYDVVLVDTAGRLQNKSGLMDELQKIKRVIEKQAPISEVLLVLDATTGQNGLVQAEAFLEVAGVTGIVLTKLDGSAKGGFVLSVQEKTGLPIKLVGQGEGLGDLTGFTPHVFAAQLAGSAP